jgi:hypothetical protein
MGFFGVLSVFGRRIKGMTRLRKAGAGVDVQRDVDATAKYRQHNEQAHNVTA